MKISTILALLVPALMVAAIPIAEPEAAAEPIAVAEIDAAPVELEVRALTRAQCKTACANGADAVERFCRQIRNIRIKPFCWAAATAAQSPLGGRACTSFCDAFF